VRIVQVLIVALAIAPIASADNFTYTMNTGTETATISDTNISCTLVAGCSGGAINSSGSNCVLHHKTPVPNYSWRKPK
jgi:hypothetical protein